MVSSAMKFSFKDVCFVLFIAANSFWLSSCHPITPRKVDENLPPAQNYNKNKVSPNRALNRPPIIINYNKNDSANSNSETTNAGKIETEPSQTNNNLLVIGRLKIPVVGVRPEDLRDTFNEARSEGRSHEAIDIIAPEETPVIAAADGQIARFFDSERGGITIYQFSSDRKLIFYYAHLKRRVENLTDQSPVKQGDVIGYVGDTGNAGQGNFHLHFAVWYVTDPKRYWEGMNINPYHLLR